MNIIESLMVIFVSLFLLLSLVFGGAQAATWTATDEVTPRCITLPGAHKGEMVKDCGDIVYIRGHYTIDQLKTIKEYQRSRGEAIKKIVIGEIQRKHEIEVRKQMIEIQTRLAEARAPKIYVGSSAYASGGKVTSEITNRHTLSNTNSLTNRQTQTSGSNPNVTTTSTATVSP